MTWSRARLHRILEAEDPQFGRAYGLFNNGVIVLAVCVYMFSTMPDLGPTSRAILSVLDVAVIAVFATDYCLRFACAPRPLRYAFSFWGLIDLISFLPALILAGSDLSSARLVRLIQLARILRLMHMTRALDHMVGAVTSVREQLLIFLFLTLIVLFLAAVGIYQFEHAAQPEVFKSVPHSLWWAVATLSTVGYGDIYPVTPGGRFFTGIVLLVGLAVIAVPTGLISAALVSKTESNQQEKEADDP
ncbi:MAG: ion transporter [Pseudomonadota bacterium]